MRDKVEEVISSRIRPLLQADGGGIELVDVEGGIVKVRLTGACHGCPAAAMTLQMGVEKLLKEALPEVERVVAV